MSAGYQWTRGFQLNRPIDINTTDPVLLTAHEASAVAGGLTTPGSNLLGIIVPSTPNGTCTGGIPVFNVPGGGSIAFATPTGQPLAPGALGLGYTGASCGGAPVGFIGTPSFFNFFRKSGPNPSFAAGVGAALSQNPAQPCFGVPANLLFTCGFSLQHGLAHPAG